MNVKIKARVAILKHYMTLLGFKDPTITARIAPVFGGAAYTFKGKEEIELERLEQAARQYPGSFNTEVVITIRGHHTALNNVLSVNREFPVEYILGSPEYLHYALREAEDAIHTALYEQARAKAVVPAADLL